MCRAVYIQNGMFTSLSALKICVDRVALSNHGYLITEIKQQLDYESFQLVKCLSVVIAEKPFHSNAFSQK